MSALSPRLAVALLLSLAACSSDKETEDTGPGPAIDLDRDGFGEAVDCDDTSAAIFPGADERCNGLDDDCDGKTDEPGAIDGVPGFTDADGDGWGDAGASVVCPGTTDTISVGEDCDDSNAAISPTATELCDGVDNDCDTLIDEPGTPDGTEYQLDQDGDGYGHPIQTGIACAEGDGYTTDASDCDDQDPARNPSADELCNNGQDDDCDGQTDESDDAPSWYPDSDGDGYGVDGETVAGCEQPEGYADNTEDCDDTDASVSPGAREDGDDGVDNDCDGEIDEVPEADAAGTYLVGLSPAYSPDFTCVRAFEAIGTALAPESLCDGCDLGFEIEATYEEGLAEDLGYDACDASDLSWGEVESWISGWSINHDPYYYSSAVAYYQYESSWYPVAYMYEDTGDQISWYFYLSTSSTGFYEVGSFDLYLD